MSSQKKKWVFIGVAVLGLVVAIAVTVVTKGWLLPENMQSSLYSSEKSEQGSESVNATPEAVADELYTWVDDAGVTHYAQKSKNKRASKVTYDSSRITPLPPVDPSVHEKVAAIVKTIPGTKQNVEQGTEQDEQLSVERKGSAVLHGIRDEMRRNQEKMQAVKDARHPDL